MKARIITTITTLLDSSPAEAGASGAEEYEKAGRPPA